MADAIKVVDSKGKRLEVYKDKVRIGPSGVWGMVLRLNGVGGCEVLADKITTLEFSKASLLTEGYLVVNYAGAPSVTHHTNVMGSNRAQSNAFFFGLSAHGEIEEAKKLIDAMIARNAGPGRSPADELKKFADLQKQGVLSAEEFAAKKKELLGL